MPKRFIGSAAPRPTRVAEIRVLEVDIDKLNLSATFRQHVLTFLQ